MSPTDAARGTFGPTATPMRVFLSHTSDLGRPDEPGSFVAAAVAAVIRARHAVTDMAYFAARETSPAATCIEMVAQTDIYVGIIGLRYGSPVRDRPDVSYTELEFESAGERSQPRLVFLIREDSVHVAPAGEPPERRARQVAFRQRLRDSGLTSVRVGSPAELELAVYQALMELGPGLDAPARLAEAQTLLLSMPLDALPERGALPAGSRMPLAANPLFVGRGDELLQVARALRGGDATVALGQVVASTGLGGLGKTQLAVELVHRYGRYFAGGVFWLSFASADEVPLQVASCARREFDSLPLEQRAQRVKDMWQSAMPRLLVFDNCEEESLLDAWRPASGGCRVLVTSRRSHWSLTLGVTALPLDLLPRADSIELLRRYRPDLAPDDPGLDQLAAELGDLPLALHLAGSYLRAYRAEVSLDGYLAELRRSDVVQHASLLGTGLDRSPSPTHHVQSVAQTFALCLGRLDRERELDRIAIALLARMACMAPGEPVPRELLAKTLDVDPLLRADGLRRLGSVGLVEVGEGWLRLHRLLAHFARQEGLDSHAQSVVERVLIDCGNDAEHGNVSGDALWAVIPHLLDAARRHSGGELSLAELGGATGIVLKQAGHFQAAAPWLEHAMVIRQRLLGSDHPATAQSHDWLAGLLWARGHLRAARVHSEQAVGIRERVLGPDHPDTAQSLNDLAILLWQLGELTAARPLHERALDIRERVLGPDHPDTTESINGLAMLLSAQGDLVAATRLSERALAIRMRVLGPNHPRTAMALNNLGVLLLKQGDLLAARAILERALETWRAVVGPEHPDTAMCINNLGRLLHEQGDPTAAQRLFESALAIRERVLGPDHPDTARSLNALGTSLGSQGDTGAALSALRRALDIRERVLGSGHPDTATSLHQLAALLCKQGDPAAARPLLKRALAIRERVLGPDHPDTVATWRALAELGAEEGAPATED